MTRTVSPFFAVIHAGASERGGIFSGTVWIPNKRQYQAEAPNCDAVKVYNQEIMNADKM